MGTLLKRQTKQGMKPQTVSAISPYPARAAAARASQSTFNKDLICSETVHWQP
jgi:hypothetical protein